MTREIAMTTIRTVLTMLNSGFSYSKIRHHTGASNGFGECRTYNYLFTKTGHKPTEAFTQRKSDCFSLVACCRRAVQEPLRGVNELHTIKYPVTAERIASDQIFRPGIPDFG